MQRENFKIALFGNVYQEKKSTAVKQFLDVAAKYGIKIAMPVAFRDFLRDKLEIDVADCELFDDDNFNADVAVCMGGDGTFLDVASRVGDKSIPIVGVNTGRLGFLANFSPDDIEKVVKDLIEGNCNVEEHSLLEISCDEIQLEGCRFALNEIAVLKHDISAMISIHTSINGEYLTTYQADGLLIGTPTGSTAYSLSVGGPIIVPNIGTISLTPVAPHSLNMRPLVVGDDSVIDLQVESRSGSFLISLDGRSHGYRDNLHLKICKAKYSAKVIRNPEHTFFYTLRNKLMWGADSRL
ncbi:MAG: NAD kinase [Bacteroidaceae bacterium]|nr:NAD kinase [Bacteroidaceae bacterium]